MKKLFRKIFSKRALTRAGIVLLGVVLIGIALMQASYLVSKHEEYTMLYLNKGYASIPFGHTKVERDEYVYCDELKSITIAGSVETIDDEAFLWCDNLRRVVFTQGSMLKTINPYAFQFTTSLKRITLPNTLRTIGDRAFSKSGLVEIIIPEGVTTLGDGVFEGCESLVTVTIPSTLTELGTQVFRNCTNLKTIEVHPNNPAFCSVDGVLYTKDMKTLVACPAQYWLPQIPDSVVEIAAYAFDHSQIYREIVVPAHVEKIGVGAFSDAAITSCVFEEGSHITEIPDYMFMSCVYLSQVNIPKTVEVIGKSAFAITNLREINIPESVHTIKDTAFNGTAVKKLNVPSTVEHYGYAVFACNDYLTEIYLPDNMTVIPDSMFSGCTALTQITIPESVATIGSYVFSYCGNLRKIHIPDSVQSIGEGTFSECTRLMEIKLPVNLTHIEASLFKSCSLLSVIDIPNAVTYIGDNAFASCRELQNLVLPPQLEYIGNAAFSGCEEITHLTIPAFVNYIGNAALSEMSNLQTLVFQKDKNRNPDTILGQRLLQYSFRLNNLTLAPHIRAIEKEAFDSCSVEKIYFTGTSSEWLAIEKYEDAMPDYGLVVFTDTYCDIHGGYETETCPWCT